MNGNHFAFSIDQNTTGMVQTLQHRNQKHEPPAWYYPVRESLGGEYLPNRQYGEAQKTFRRDLEINPNNPRSLFGLSEALRGQMKNAEAEEFHQRFEKAWKDADVPLSVTNL